MADILAQLASSSAGFHKILYGPASAIALTASESEPVGVPPPVFVSGHETPAHVVASFTLRALTKDGDAFESMGDGVTGAFLYVCRQLYTTCEGSLILRPFRLHVHVAQAWKIAARKAAEVATPTPRRGDEVGSVQLYCARA